MPQVPIVAVGESAVVFLPAAVLGPAGLRVGDLVDVTVGDRQVILLQPVEGVERRRLIKATTRAVFAKRQKASRRLAEGGRTGSWARTS